MADISPFPRLFAGLMTNSSHALNKIQFESLTDKSKLNGNAHQPELFIRLKPDKASKTLSIIDNGTGLTKADLGASVRSEGQKYSEALHAFADDTNMIDQIGVNFYSAYLVVEKVTVTTRHNDDVQCIWESQAGFTVTRDVNGEQLGRGTNITLFLKEDQLEYLEEGMIKDLVEEHSKLISYPIYLWTKKTCELDEREKEEEGEIIVDEVSSYEWQLISQPKRFTGMRKDNNNMLLCKTIKGILGDKVVDVIISREGFGDSSSCRITRKRILEMNPESRVVEELKKMVESEQNEESAKVVVLLLFETALLTNTKKAQWRKWAMVLNVCIIHVTAAVSSCVMSGCAGDN